MHQITTAIVSFTLASLIAGCTTVTKPVPQSDTVQAPTDRLYAYQNRRNSTDATLIITRDQGFGCYSAFYINDQLAARLDNAETATFYVTPGEILMRYGRDPEGKGLCGSMQGHWSTQETTLDANETKRFRLTIIRGGEFKIQRAE